MAFYELLLALLRIEKRKIILVGSADRKLDVMSELYFMTAFSSDKMARNRIAPVYSDKRIKKVFLQEVSQRV